MQTVVAKRWGGVGRLVNFVGIAAVDAMAAMEKRGLPLPLGAFKEVEGIIIITPDGLREIVGYMDGIKSTLPSLKKIMKDVKKTPNVVLAHTSSRGGYQWTCQQHQRYVLVKQGFVFE